MCVVCAAPYGIREQTRKIAGQHTDSAAPAASCTSVLVVVVVVVEVVVVVAVVVVVVVVDSCSDWFNCRSLLSTLYLFWQWHTGASYEENISITTQSYVRLFCDSSVALQCTRHSMP